MNTLVDRSTQTICSTDAAAGYEDNVIPQRSETELGLWGASRPAPRHCWRSSATPVWCRESSSDLSGGLSISEVPADTIPDELYDDLFNLVDA